MDPRRALQIRLNWYGMTVEEYFELIAEQGGRCACCEEVFRRPFIDHDHETAAVRGILCARCNNWLAAFEHPTFAGHARKYLAKFAEAPVRFRMRDGAFRRRQKQKADAKARRIA